MPLFRFAIYFAMLTACAVAAFPHWAPASTDAEAAALGSASAAPPYSFTHKKTAPRSHPAPPARVASRD